MAKFFFQDRSVDLDGKTVTVRRNGNWINVDVHNQYKRLETYGYSLKDKRWSYGNEPKAGSVAHQVLTTKPEPVATAAQPASTAAFPAHHMDRDIGKSEALDAMIAHDTYFG